MISVGEMLSTEDRKEKEANRTMLRIIIESIRFLARQGLALRGQKDDTNSNFSQLLLLRGIDCPALLTWLNKKSNKYTSGEIQNEFLEIMALHILRQICSDIAALLPSWLTSAQMFQTRSNLSFAYAGWMTH